MADNGCQPTSDKFKKTCENLGINLAFTSYNNPKGNADTERFMRTMKEECLWINEFDNLEHLAKSLTNWVGEYNKNYLKTDTIRSKITGTTFHPGVTKAVYDCFGTVKSENGIWYKQFNISSD